MNSFPTDPDFQCFRTFFHVKHSYQQIKFTFFKFFAGDLPSSTQQKLVPVDDKKGYGLKTFGNVNIFSDGVYQVVIVNTKKG